MSLMVSPVSKISFRSQSIDSASQSTAEDILSRPGAFTKPAESANTESAPKKHKLLKYLAGALITVGVVAGALYGLKRGFPNVFKVTENIKDLKGMEKVKAFLTTGVAKGAEYVERGTGWVARTCTDGWDKLLRLVHIRKAS